VVLACRTADKGRRAAELIVQSVPGARLRVLDEPLELTSLRSTAEYAAAARRAVPSLDALVCNAGVMAAPFELTGDGHELHYQTNHLGHFALANLLLPSLREAAQPRCVHVSSIAAYGPGFDVADLDWSTRRYERWGAYCASKRENVIFSDELAARQPWLTSVALHPGVVDTNLVRYLVPPTWLAGERAQQETPALFKLLGMRSAEEGAQPSLWALQSDEFVVSGAFYLDAAQLAPEQGRPGGGADAAELREKLWEKSESALAAAGITLAA
jgi:NAD(P)-dependent dehydrogenase (short-subunit alcohol dehydrogenase family)